LVDLNEVVSDAIRLVRTDALLRNTAVVSQPAPSLARVLGDGLEATAERPPGERWVSVRTAESETGGIQFTVEDSGKGVADSDLARVFEPFFSTKQEGLGMGLSISRSIVQAHGGQIWAESRAGGGAIFHCLLPVAQQAAAALT
jgi:signal transduction histidine kinase